MTGRKLVRDLIGPAVTCYDELVEAYAHPNRDALTAEDVMNERIPHVRPDIPLSAAAQLMQDMGVRMLFLMPQRGGITYPAAMLSYRQLLRHLAARDDDELSDLGINAIRGPVAWPRQKTDGG